MKTEDVQELDHGVYLIYWKTGGSSLASVGSDNQGRRWMAPTNWVTVPSFTWSAVERVELVISSQAMYDTQAANLYRAWAEEFLPEGFTAWDLLSEETRGDWRRLARSAPL